MQNWIAAGMLLLLGSNKSKGSNASTNNIVDNSTPNNKPKVDEPNQKKKADEDGASTNPKHTDVDNKPDDMSVYKDALQNWDTTDSLLLSKTVDTLVNFHIRESDEDQYKDRTPDFPSSDYFIFPIEILLWLNIRERMMLPDYTPDNELMKLPINDWHIRQTEIPKIELIHKAKDKLQKDNPHISFEL